MYAVSCGRLGKISPILPCKAAFAANVKEEGHQSDKNRSGRSPGLSLASTAGPDRRCWPVLAEFRRCPYHSVNWFFNNVARGKFRTESAFTKDQAQQLAATNAMTKKTRLILPSLIFLFRWLVVPNYCLLVFPGTTVKPKCRKWSSNANAWRTWNCFIRAKLVQSVKEYSLSA